MTAFISYSRNDSAVVRNLVADIESTGHDVWLDRELTGGRAWWATILEQIRNCTVFIVAVSDAALDSQPCRAERAYADALGIPVLPVFVAPVRSTRDDVLFTRQAIDYREPTPAVGIALVRALGELSAIPRSQPHQLPPEPPVPYEYLHRIGDAIRADRLLSSEELHTMVQQLCQALISETEPSVVDDVHRLLSTIRARPDTTPEITCLIDETVQRGTTTVVPRKPRAPKLVMIGAVISTLLCSPFGVGGMYYGAKSAGLWEAGSYDAARHAAKLAKIWTAIGVLFVIGYFSVIIAINATSPS